jgi:hypothetical protein
MTDLSNTLIARGQLDEAEKTLVQALAVFDSTLGPEHPATIVTHGLHGRALCELGRAAEAETELRASRDRLAAIYGPTHERTIGVNISLARAVAAKNDPREADALFRSIIDGSPKAISASQLAEARSSYGVFLTQSRRFAAAEKQLLAAEKSLREARGGSLRTKAAALDGLVALYEAWDLAEPGAGKSKEASKWREVREKNAQAGQNE